MEKVKKIIKSTYMPFIILALILIIIHVPINKTNDDLWFENILNNDSLINYTIYRYNDWTSRVIIEMILVLISNSHVSLIIWKVFNIVIFEILAYSTYYIFIRNIKQNGRKIYLTWFMVILIFTLPLNCLRDAGWIATTANYLWVLSIRNVFNNTYKKKH